MCRIPLAASVLVIALFAAPVAIAAPMLDPILINGSFEIGPPPFGNHDVDIPGGSTAITGWTATGGGVDLLEDPWDVSDGLRAVDLDLRSPGGIEQRFTTSVGQRYQVLFDLSGNPEGGPQVKQMRVTAGSFSEDFAFDSVGQTIDSLIWQRTAFSFTASDDFTTLSFASLSPAGSAYGALIDNVSVDPVPEPSTLALLSLGLAVAYRQHRRRASR